LRAQDVSLIVSDFDSYSAHRGVDGAEFPPGVTARAFCIEDLLESQEAAAFAEGSAAILLDVSDPRLVDWARGRGLPGKAAVYAFRESKEDEGLKAEGFVFDEEARRYFRPLSPANAANAVRRILSLKAAPGLAYGPPEEFPFIGLYHPGAPGTFGSADEYFAWYKGTPAYGEGKPWLGLMFFEAFLEEAQRPAVDEIIRILESEGFNLLPAFGPDLPVLEGIFLDPERKSRVDALVSFSLKFYLSYAEGMTEAVRDLGVPVFNALSLYSLTIGEWRASPQGIPAADLTWNFDGPETSGAPEPSILMGKVDERLADGARVYRYECLPGETRRLARRAARHVALARKPPAEKKAALLYYNNTRGKQSVGAAYLNVFRSIVAVAEALAAAGWQVPLDPPLTEEEIKGLALRGGRNIGAWAPAELDGLIGSGGAVLWPADEYRKLFAGLPEDLRKKVLAQWGEPEDGKIMTRDGNLVIPVIIRGNLAMLPQPARGAEDDPLRLYHDPAVYPHHQYLAVYLWLEHVWKADALIHLGTHGTLEWMPGKQAGTALSDSPEVLLGTLPDFYPYSMDVVAEGIQAKRRGRAVLVGHLIPPLVKAGRYGDYVRLSGLVDLYRAAARNASPTAGGHMAQIASLASELALEKDIGLEAVDGPEAVEALSVYLEYLSQADVPFGLHTLGTPPSGEAADALLGLMEAENPGLDRGKAAERLARSGPLELDSLLRGLSGAQVEPGEGGDPARNPEALPSGRNFHGIFPSRIPSREAWRLGREAADSIIRSYREKHGTFPDKVAVVIWATEAVRNEGLNEATALALIGVEPVWSPAGLVTGSRPIPGRVLGRPRIDVTIDASGLYRDLFPDRLIFLDRAIRQAAIQDDVENFIARGDEGNLRALIAKGHPPEEALALSRARIFSERPGSYGNRVPETASASGTWENPWDVALAFREHTGYAYGEGAWGTPARDSLELNLAGSKVAWHSASSHLWGALDDDDFAGYLGGLSLAITSLSGGNSPETLVSDARANGKVSVMPLARFIGQEIRARYLNPAWIEGMLAEGYAGAGEMARFVEHLWGFQVTAPQEVSPGLWDQAYRTYVEDSLGLDLPGFLDRENPWAFQSITARMLEAVRKGYWSPPEEVRRRLAAEYAESVALRGAACSDLVCDNPFLARMAADLASVPGAADPDPDPKTAESFRAALEQAGRGPLEDQAAAREGLIRDLGDRRGSLDSNPPGPAAVPEAPETPESSEVPAVPESPAALSSQEAPAAPSADAESVRGLKMERQAEPDEAASQSSSWLEWTLPAFALAVIAVFYIGYRRRGRAGGGRAPAPAGGMAANSGGGTVSGAGKIGSSRKSGEAQTGGASGG
jgi:cobaltochelatase CobN